MTLNPQCPAYLVTFTEQILNGKPHFLCSDNLSKGLHNDKCTDCKSYLEYLSIKDELLVLNCLKCSKNYDKEFSQDLIKRFSNTYRFCDRDNNKFCLMLRKDVYPCKYMDS